MDMTRRPTVLSSDELLHRVLLQQHHYTTVRDRPGETWIRDSDCRGRRSSTGLEVVSDLRWAAISYIPAKIITPTSMVEKLEKS